MVVLEVHLIEIVDFKRYKDSIIVDRVTLKEFVIYKMLQSIRL